MRPTHSFQQRERGIFVYPAGGWRKAFFKMPLIFWRMGLEALLRPFRMIVLTTRGRKSGEPRYTVLEHSFMNGRAYIAPGWGTQTQWYLNVLAHPRVTVQRYGHTFAANAVVVCDNNELASLYQQRRESPVWKQFLDSWGVENTLEDFLAKKDRIPTLRLDPVEGEPPLPPLTVDLWWTWAVPVLGGFAVYRMVR